jgi:glycosidase
MTTTWAHDAIFYHIYPLGMLGAPEQNNFVAAPEPRLAQLHNWIPHLRDLGVNALYLGPLFESGAHGYDTVDYLQVDRRLGTNQTLADLNSALHDNGIRVILDGVFHHVGRDFWAFRDVQANGEHSAYRDWFVGLHFGGHSPYGDPFTYEAWQGHYNLVKLNLQHPDVRAHLFAAIEQWVEQFGIDGLRLDVAEDIDLDFLRDLAAHCRQRWPDFWLLGEVIHGDYRRWANPEILDSVTNYEAYKGLYSSHNDGNYFEIAYSLNRQFGAQGMYRDTPLYVFADNHDVNRIASVLRNPAHLYPLHALLFTIPGVPSIYYGSEWGIGGKKQNGSDEGLRPQFNSPAAGEHAPHPDLAPVIARLAHIRQQTTALRRGAYEQLLVAHEQLAFARQWEGEYVVVAVNSAAEPASLRVPVTAPDGQTFVDLLAPEQHFTVQQGHLNLADVPACWACILAPQQTG